MASVANIKVRSLRRGTPPVYIGSQLLSPTVDTSVNVNDPLVRRDLHAYVGQWVVSAAGLPAVPVSPDTHGTITAIDTQTGANVANATPITTNTAAGDNSGGWDTSGHRDTFITLINALQTDYALTIEDLNDLFAAVSELQTIVTQINTSLKANGFLS